MLTEQQKQERRTGIGGSEIAAVLGCSPFQTPLDVWLSKTEGYERPNNPDMERGNFLEAGIGAWYAHRCGASVVHGETTRHARHPEALCTPDFWAGNRLVSIKAPRRGGIYWGESGTDMVPEPYALQLQWEALVCGSHREVDPELHLAALVDGELRVYRLQSDPELQGWILDFVRDWWARHIVGGVPPELQPSSAASDWMKRRFPRVAAPVRQATPEEDLLLLSLRDSKRALRRHEGEVDLLELRLKEAIGSSEGIQSPTGVATWRADKNGKRVLRTKFTEEE